MLSQKTITYRAVPEVRVLLINPPYSRFKGVDSRSLPLNLGYIAAYLEKDGYTVGIYNADLISIEEKKRFPGRGLGWQVDMNRHSVFVETFEKGYDYIWDEVNKVVADFKPNIVGMTAVTVNFRSALRVAQICKNIIPDVLVVVGGPHSTVLPESVLANENIDFVVRGEGELSFLELIKNLSIGINPSNVRGISYKDENKIVHNAPGPFIDDLDSIPFPARNLLIDSAGYNTGKAKTLHNQILISRGCPYTCNFCATNILWSGYKWRTRSVKNVIEEIRFLINKYGIEELYLFSDTFSANKGWTLDFCKEIKPLKIKWNCSTRIDKINEEIIIAMKGAGCTVVSLGIESGSNRILKNIGKKITIEQVETAIDMLDKVGMPWTSFFMIGFPAETRGDIEDTFKFIKKLKPQSHKIAVAVPYPGTALYNEVKTLNLFPEKVDWNWFDGRSRYISMVSNIGKKEFIELRDRIFNYVDRYNNLNILKHMLRTGAKMLFTNPREFLKKLLNKAFLSS